MSPIRVSGVDLANVDVGAGVPVVRRRRVPRTTLMKQWSAILPLAMSVVGLALIFGHVATSGGVRETDEGTAAHLWQLLMAVQLPVVAFFAIAWLPRAPVQGVLILALQVLAVLANLAALRYFDL